MDSWREIYLARIEAWRNELKRCPRYRGVKWETKVSLMPPRQVEAVYKKFKKDGYFDENYIPPKKELKGQISMFSEEQIEMDLSSLF